MKGPMIGHNLGDLAIERTVNDGNVVALSGPVPYFWGYGSPVV